MDLKALLLTRCPRCKRGPIFPPLPAGIWAVNDACPACGLPILREAGYFLGAMYVSYGLAVLTILPVSLVLALWLEWPLATVMIVVVVLTLVSVPLLLRYSRAIWLHLDHAIDPSTR